METIIKELVRLLEDESDKFSSMRDIGRHPIRDDDQVLKTKSKLLHSAAFDIKRIDLIQVDSIDTLRLQVEEIINEECYNYFTRNTTMRFMKRVFEQPREIRL